MTQRTWRQSNNGSLSIGGKRMKWVRIKGEEYQLEGIATEARIKSVGFGKNLWWCVYVGRRYLGHKKTKAEAEKRAERALTRQPLDWSQSHKEGKL
jgi:hypothetical protein